MILSLIQNAGSAGNMLYSSATLAEQLGKKLTVGSLQHNDTSALKDKLSELGIKPDLILPEHTVLEDITARCETNEISFLFIQLIDNKSKYIRKLLKCCRELRIPYVFYRNDFPQLDLTKVIVPVSFLQEEVEKAQFAAAFGRFCGSEILLLQANDYGSKAATNVTRMKELFDKFDFSYSVDKAAKDSFKVEFDAVERATSDSAGMVIISASRDYGLDDIILGPKEQHVIRRSSVPVLLVNPRGDLYALCD